MKKLFVLKLICLTLIVGMVAPMIISCDVDNIVGDIESENNTTEAPTEKPIDKHTEEKTTEAPTDEPTDEPTDGVTTEEPTEAPSDEDPTTDDPTTEKPTEVPTDEDPITDDPTTEKPTEAPSDEVTTTEKPTEKPTEVPTEKPTEEVTSERNPDIEGLDIDSSKMHANMQNIFAGDTVHRETVMFIDKGETTMLLFPIDEIVSVQSYNGRKTYVEGRDYTVVDGKLHIPASSTINVITSKNYYNYAGMNGQMIYENYNGINVPVYWGEGDTMTQYQLIVTYKHSKAWDGFLQETYAKKFEGLIRKLMAGEDVTFIFYGDSITCGSNASWFIGNPTTDWDNPKKVFFQWSYTMLFTQALADMFGYTIHFVDVSYLAAVIKKPPEDYVAGTRGTITYINTSVGGWTSEGGLNNFDKHIKPFIEEYGCDLLGVAFGMNDPGVSPTKTADNIKKIYEKAMALDNDFYALIVSTMLPNNKATNGWFGNQYLQEPELIKLVDQLNRNGVGAGIARVSSVTESMLERVDFRDYTGNNINHPNDFMQRIYAQTCLQAFIGYENMK